MAEAFATAATKTNHTFIGRWDKRHSNDSALRNSSHSHFYLVLRSYTLNMGFGCYRDSSPTAAPNPVAIR